MKKDVNFTMGAIIMILLVSIAGITIYYNSTYQQLNQDYQDALRSIEKTRDELNQTGEDIRQKESALIDIINELNLSKQRVSSIGEYYTSLKGEKVTLETNLEQTKQDRDAWKSDYNLANLDLKECEAEYTAMESKFSIVNSSLIRFQAMGDDITEYANDGRGYTAELDIQASEIKESIDELRGQINRLDAACENDSIDEIESNIDSIRKDIYDANDEIEKMVQELKKILDKIKDRAT